MARLTLSKRINAPLQDVWASWNDFGNIAAFNPSVSKSYLLTDKDTPTRIGTRRHCDLAGSKNWVREEITGYRQGERLVIDVYESSMPVKTMTATLEFETIGEDQTQVRFTAEFEPGMGVIGKLMAPLMKRQFRPMLAAMLDGNADFLERGTIAVAAA